LQDDEDVKNKMISELSMENRRLKEELAKTHFAKFRIEQDLTSKWQWVDDTC
jgi:hypothetical protein